MAAKEKKLDPVLEEKIKTAGETRIPIMIPKSKEHQEDVWVCINGEGTQIKRGVTVMVTPAVYEVLQNKFAMEDLALERQLELQNMAKERKAFD